MIGPEDDSLHDASGSPYWTEGARFPFHVPEREVGGWIALDHRPPLAHALGGLALWDGSGAHPQDCLFHDFGRPWARDPAWDVHDCALPNRLTVETIKPLEAFHVSYLRDECQADLTWVAAAEPVALPAPVGGGRFEQPGRLTGTVAVRGDILHVDCWSVRDRWWGASDHRPGRPDRHRTDSPCGFDEAGDGFRLHVVAAAEPAHDPVHGTTERLVTGWHRADGVTRPLVSGGRRVSSRGRDGRPLWVEVRGEDDLGRALVADGECVNHLRPLDDPDAAQWWSTVRWRLRDRPAWGELRESMPLELSRRVHRSHRPG